MDGIPSSNIALFDELQSHGLVDATPEGKAVWNATVADDGWEHRFTFLRLQPSLVWANEPRPAYFGGTVDPTMDDHVPTSGTSQPTPNWPESGQEEKHPDVNHPTQDCDYLEDLMDMLQEPGELKSESNTASLQPAAPPSQNTVGLAFLKWLRDGIHTHRLVINDSRAKVHTVDGTFFLVTPGIFQRYTVEHPEQSDGVDQSEPWRQIQRHFQKLNVHLKRPNGQNIWTCSVRGPRKTSSLNGYLLRDKTILEMPPPPDNTFIEIKLN
ncbi:helicase/relaxase domain-containing protein [Pseudomonas putida]